MVLLNVAATRGPMPLWAGYKMQNFAPALTLRAVAEMVLPVDHAGISRVEGRSKMNDTVSTDVTGALDCDVKSIFDMGVTAITFFLQFDDEPVPAVEWPAKRSVTSVLMTAQRAKSRFALTCQHAQVLTHVCCRSFYWPDDIPAGQNQAVRDVANRMVGMLRADPGEYGGFSDPESARHKNNQFLWRLAQISLDLSPSISTMKDQHCRVPRIFVDAVGRPAANRKVRRIPTRNSADPVITTNTRAAHTHAAQVADGDSVYEEAQGLDDNDFLLEPTDSQAHADPVMADQALNDAVILNATLRESNADAALTDVRGVSTASIDVEMVGAHVPSSQGCNDGDFLLGPTDSQAHADPVMANQALNDAAILNATVRESNADVAPVDAEVVEPAVVIIDHNAASIDVVTEEPASSSLTQTRLEKYGQQLRNILETSFMWSKQLVQIQPPRAATPRCCGQVSESACEEQCQSASTPQ